MKILKTITFLLVLIIATGGTVNKSKMSKKDRLDRMKILGLACHIYSTAHNMLLPTKVKDLIDNPEGSTFIDPKWLEKDEYIMLIKGKKSDYKDPNKTIMISEKQADKDGKYAVCFLDGHAKIIKRKNTKAKDELK